MPTKGDTLSERASPFRKGKHVVSSRTNHSHFYSKNSFDLESDDQEKQPPLRDAPPSNPDQVVSGDLDALLADPDLNAGPETHETHLEVIEAMTAEDIDAEPNNSVKSA
jgi:hypothetical protein